MLLAFRARDAKIEPYIAEIRCVKGPRDGAWLLISSYVVYYRTSDDVYRVGPKVIRIFPSQNIFPSLKKPNPDCPGDAA